MTAHKGLSGCYSFPETINKVQGKEFKSDKIFAFVPIATQTILGSHFHGKANFMALGWLTRCNFKPPMIVISVNKSNQSAGGILDHIEFSANVPSTNMVAITDYIGLVSAKKQIKPEFLRYFMVNLKALR